MSIIGIDSVTPKNIRNVMPDMYKGMAYRQLKEGDKVTIINCTFSVYQAKKDSEPLVTKSGLPVTNVTVYFGLDDGSYTSLKNDIVTGQIAALTGFDKENVIGQYDYSFEPERVKVVKAKTKMGNKEVDVLAFESDL